MGCSIADLWFFSLSKCCGSSSLLSNVDRVQTMSGIFPLLSTSHHPSYFNETYLWTTKTKMAYYLITGQRRMQHRGAKVGWMNGWSGVQSTYSANNDTIPNTRLFFVIYLYFTEKLFLNPVHCHQHLLQGGQCKLLDLVSSTHINEVFGWTLHFKFWESV